MWVLSLGQKDPLDEEMATHSSILAWKIPCTEEPGRMVCGVTKSWTLLKSLSAHTYLHIYVYLFVWLHWVLGMWNLKHMESLVAAFRFVCFKSCCIWDLVLWLGIEPGLLHWEHRVSATGPPGKSHHLIFEAVYQEYPAGKTTTNLICSLPSLWSQGVYGLLICTLRSLNQLQSLSY